MAALAFTGSTLIIGVLVPGFDHASQQISELGARGAPHALAMNLIGFASTGLLTVGFGFALRGSFWQVDKRPTGPTLIMFGGLGLLAVAFFSCDPGCELGSARATRHSVAAGLTILCTILAQFLFSRTFRSDARWRKYAVYSLTSALIATGSAFAFAISYLAGLDRWIGASERVLVGVSLLWMSSVSIQLYRISEDQPA